MIEHVNLLIYLILAAFYLYPPTTNVNYVQSHLELATYCIIIIHIKSYLSLPPIYYNIHLQIYQKFPVKSIYLLGSIKIVGGFRSKLNPFVVVFNYVFIYLSETWLCESVGDNELGLINYIIYRCDRNLSTSNLQRGGGTLIVVRKDIALFLISPLPSTNVEQLFVKISTQKITGIINSVYIPLCSPSTIYESYIYI